MSLSRQWQPYGRFMQMGLCCRRRSGCSVAGCPILINCKSLLATRACEQAQQPEPSLGSGPDRGQAMETRQLVHFLGHRINNNNAGNKLHNTRMLSRKLVLIFKALHYSQPARIREASIEKGRCAKKRALKSMLQVRA